MWFSWNHPICSMANIYIGYIKCCSVPNGIRFQDILMISSSYHCDTRDNISYSRAVWHKQSNALLLASTRPISGSKDCWATGTQCMPNQNHYYCYLFLKIKTKQDNGVVFWWIYGHVSLLKLEKKCCGWQSLYCASNRYCFQQEILRFNKQHK